MGKTFKTAKTKVDDGKKWEDDLPFEMVDIRQLAKGEYRGIRLVGHIEPFMRFWVPTDAKKAYDPYKTKCKMYPSICTDFDPEEEVFSGNKCLYRKAHFPVVQDDGSTKYERLKPTKNYLIFFIDREMQEEREGIPVKKKFQQPEKFSDIKCATVPTAFAREVQNAIEMFEKTKSEADPTDPQDGFDLFFKFDPAASAEAKYNIMLGDAVALTKAELKQCELIPESVDIYPKDSPTKIAESLARHGYLIVEQGEDPEEVAAAASSGKKASKSTMKAGAELLDDDDDEDEEEAPAKKTRVVAESDDDEFVDEEGDLDDDDDDLDDDGDFGDDDEDEAEAEEETPAPKKKAAAKKKSKPEPEEDEGDDDDDDDDFDFDDDDFE